MTSAVIYNTCNHRKQLGSKILCIEFLGGNILMSLVIIKSLLVPVKKYNKFNQGNFQKTDTEGKSQNIAKN